MVVVELTEAEGSWIDLARQRMALLPDWEIYSHHVIGALILISAIMDEGHDRHRVEQWDGPVALYLKYK